ncbi:MAG TPA: carboxypeptidase regulatory-like domain-containing protein [Pyrinomonadaceae bacterium]|jgi:uncharacterized delta-60 repeat protein|nr:carboxypeptidase regulatory-like domain-containing protein [Pyrinomonadaceae bacterium]
MKLRLFLAVIVLAAFSSGVPAAPGDLDWTFNYSGNLITQIGEGLNYVPNSLLAIQTNGKIVAVSNSGTFTFPSITVIRLNTTGTYDPSFGTDGKSVISFPTWKRSNAMAIQADGKILVTGWSSDSPGDSSNNPSCVITRLNTDGTLDTPFNGTGLLKTAPGNFHCKAEAIAVQPDGKIVVAGFADQISPANSTVAWATLRLNADGTPDTGYGPDGFSLSTPANGGFYRGVKSVLIGADGKIFVCGYVNNPPQYDFAAARFNAAGGIDTSFGTGGVASIVTPPNEFPQQAALQSDGKIVFVGNRFSDFTLARMNTDGSVDTSFGTSGFTITPEDSMGTTKPSALLIQPDGKILVGGTIMVGGLSDFAVARYNADGSLDQLRPAGKKAAIFGKKGSALQSLQPMQPMQPLQPMQELWGSGGIAIGGFANWDDELYSMAMDAAGRVVVSGYSRLDGWSGHNLALTRFLSESAPTASIYGTIKTATGMPIRNVSVVLSEGPLSEPRYALTNQFGLYSFTDLPITEKYSVSISSKRFNFLVEQQTVTLLHDENSMDFNAEP